MREGPYSGPGEKRTDWGGGTGCSLALACDTGRSRTVRAFCFVSVTAEIGFFFKCEIPSGGSIYPSLSIHPYNTYLLNPYCVPGLVPILVRTGMVPAHVEVTV